MVRGAGETISLPTPECCNPPFQSPLDACVCGDRRLLSTAGGRFFQLVTPSCAPVFSIAPIEKVKIPGPEKVKDEVASWSLPGEVEA